MKTQIRYGVFETNSSSTHTLTILNDAEYEQLIKDTNDPTKYWKKDKYVDLVEEFDYLYNNHLFPMYVETDIYNVHSDEDKIQYMLKNFDYRDSYTEAVNVVEKTVDLPNGNKLHIISRFGYDY